MKPDPELSRDPLDEALDRALRSVQASADPAVWTRARARLAERAAVPRGLGWAARPHALALSLALFCASVTLCWMLVRALPQASDDETSLAQAVQSALGASRDDVTIDTGSSGGAAGDSGAAL
jgi:hypothetical protein